MERELTKTPFLQLLSITDRYASLAYENYSLVRSLAERLRDGFCGYLQAGDGDCVFLIPPNGSFIPRNYGSSAFSTAGNSYLQLAPISFGLAVRVSAKDDWLRVVFSCSVEGGKLQAFIEGGINFDLDLPLDDKQVQAMFEPLYRHIYDWFDDRVVQYEQGSYGSREIGFEIINASNSGSEK